MVVSVSIVVVGVVAAALDAIDKLEATSKCSPAFVSWKDAVEEKLNG